MDDDPAGADDFEAVFGHDDGGPFVEAEAEQFRVGVNNRGRARLGLGQNEAAIPDFDESLRLEPENGAALNNRGIARTNTGKHAAAIEDYTESIRLSPGSAVTYENRAISHKALGNEAAAQADLAKAAELKKPR